MNAVVAGRRLCGFEMGDSRTTIVMVPLLVLLLMLVGIGGCRTTGPWEPVEQDGPWVAPGVQAQAARRRSEPSPLIVAVGGYESVWIGANDKRISKGDVSGETEVFLAAHGQMLEWHTTGCRVSGTEQLLTPYRLTLVSLSPTVVVMTRWDYGAREGRSLHELLSPKPRHYLSWSFTTPFPLNDLGYGTRVPYAAEILWFSPDLKQPPTAVAVVSDRAEIRLPDGRLSLTREGNEWVVRRVR